MATNAHHDPSRPRHPITIVSTDQGPRVGPYIFGKTLGTGSTGKVKLAKNLVTGDIVAIKIVRKDYLDNKPSLKKKMRREISVLKVLSHPNLMSLIDVFEIETHLFLVMEFVDGLELFEYLVRRGALPIPQALSFFQQIICGLEYCHRRLICHRDLKPENLLLDRNLNIKIADFGMTSLNPPGSLLETSCGSPHYCDPMVVSGEMYDGLKADIWSCGVILYAMVTGRLPFDDDNVQRLLQKVQVGQYHLPSDLPKDLRDLIKQMLTVDPEQRITLNGIKAHPWFNSIPPANYVEDTFVAPSDPVMNPDPMILRSLVDLGWGDAQSIKGELAKAGSSMAKVFYKQLERHPMFRRTSTGAPAPAPVAPSPTSTIAAARPPRPEPMATAPHAPPPTVPSHANHTHPNQAAGIAPVAVPAPVQVQVPVPVPVPAPAPAPVPAPDPAPAPAPAPVFLQPPPVLDASALHDRLAAISLQNATAAEGDVPERSEGKDGAADGQSEAQVGKPSDPDDAQSGSGTGGNLVRQSSLMGVAESGANDERVEEAIKSVEASKQKSWFESMSNYLTGSADKGEAGDEETGRRENGETE